MPIIYLSPSTQEFNPYITGGNEEQYMNLIADAMVPYLRSSGILYRRNNPDMTTAEAIAASNAGNYDLHLALHSNASPESAPGSLQGTDVYYYPTSTQGRRAAEIIARNFRMIYPNPSRVRAVPTTSIGEVSRTRAPSVLIETAYHDNPQDADWIKSNVTSIARNLVMSLTEFFGIPFIEAQPQRQGRVTSNSLNIYQKPDTSSPVVATAPRGAQLLVNGAWNSWYVVRYDSRVGYAESSGIQII